MASQGDSELHRHLSRAEDAQAFAEGIVETVREPLLVLDDGLKVVFANRSFYRTFAVSPQQTLGQPLYVLGNGQWDIPVLRKALGAVTTTGTEFEDFDVQHRFPDIGEKSMRLNGRRLEQPGRGAP